MEPLTVSVSVPMIVGDEKSPLASLSSTENTFPNKKVSSKAKKSTLIEFPEQ
ncbi:MAG: hypothetical protein IPN88_15945 [Bacteroidetes bacterium]|nr:hypothetical protein [Bacteroidota bacterium]